MEHHQGVSGGSGGGFVSGRVLAKRIGGLVILCTIVTGCCYLSLIRHGWKPVLFAISLVAALFGLVWVVMWLMTSD